jgi:hypothetical protein
VDLGQAMEGLSLESSSHAPRSNARGELLPPLDGMTSKQFALELIRALEDVPYEFPGDVTAPPLSGAGPSNAVLPSQSSGPSRASLITQTSTTSHPPSVPQAPAGSAAGSAAEWAAQLTHQTLTCFIPTLAREIGAEAAGTYLRNNRFAQIAISTVLAGGRVLADRVRHQRLNAAIEEAARNGNGFGPDRWAAMPAERRQNYVNRTLHQSEWVRTLQHVSGALSFGLTVAGAVGGDRYPFLGDMGSTAMANEIRNVIYAFMRDSGNALMNSVSVVAGPGGEKSRTNNANMQTSAGIYGATQALGSVASGYAVGAFNQTQGVNAHGVVSRNARGSLLNAAEFAQNAVGVGAIRAFVNTLIETLEAWLQNRYQAIQAQGVQQVQWGINNDLVRLRDHSVARLAWNSGGSLTSQATGTFGQAEGVPGQPHIQQVINAIGQALAFGLTYIMVNATYQAHAGVRAATRDARHAPPDVEQDIPLEERSSVSGRSDRTGGTGDPRRTGQSDRTNRTGESSRR